MPFTAISSMSLSDLFGLWSAVMEIIGGFILAKGFFGKNYDSLYSESASTFDYNQSAYTSLSEQKNSGIIGFVILLFGFVEQAISYIPYQTSLSVLQVTAILTLVNVVAMCILLPLRRCLINFDVGLLKINWQYTNSTNSIPSDYIQTYITNHLANVEGHQRTVDLERRAKRNPFLFLGIAKVGAKKTT